MTTKPIAALAALGATLALAGCAGGVTGLAGAREEFGCPASGGVNCTTVSATYEREHADQKAFASLSEPRPSARAPQSEPQPDARIRVSVAEDGSGELRAAEPRPAVAATSAPRAPERLVMLWVLPWVDAEGDLHSQGRVWMRVRDAAWRIESVRSRAMKTAPGSAP